MRRLIFVWMICLGATSGAADAELSFSVRLTACEIELAHLNFPQTYLIAEVEHTGDLECAGAYCAEKVRILKVLEAGRQFDLPKVIKIPEGKKVDAKQAAARKGAINIGVYVPASNGTDYRALNMTQFSRSDESIVLDEYLEAANAAALASKGSPHCDKNDGLTP